MSKCLNAAIVTALAIGLYGAVPGGPARASITVFGSGLAAQCSKDAKFAAETGFVDPKSIDQCGLAIDFETLTFHELAATHVNRGILYLTHMNYARANRDFDASVNIEPTLGEGYVNRGAAYIVQRKFKKGIAEINRGLAFNPDEPEKAYFNRALAEEYLDDMKSAYFDYIKASELKPDWDKPWKELIRFTVTRPSGRIMAIGAPE